MILLGGCIVLFIVSVLQERGIKIREKISERSFAVQFILYAGLLLSIGFFGSTAAVRGFIYAQF
jgi:alginate O-acetyltransferase complex protein AlgI